MDQPAQSQSASEIVSDESRKLPLMSTQEQVTDSPTGWVAKHIESYLNSDGEQGHEWYGVNALLLTTRGRKSGQLRRTALYYGQDGDRYLLVASKGGADDHPNWYLNLSADPHVQVQIKSDRFTATARTATAEEKPRLWQIMSDLFPKYIDYQQSTKREIPIVILTRDLPSAQ